MAASALLTTPIRSSICVSSVFVFFVFTLVVSVLQNPTFCYGKTSTFVRKTEKGHDMPADSDVFSDLPGMKSHSQDFLLVIPIDGLGQCMSPVEYRSILKYRLMIPLFSAGEVCPIPNCRRVLDAFGEHAVHCKELPVFKYRHDLVRDVLCDTFRRAGISVKKEAPMNFLTDPRDGRSTLRPADVLVFGWSGGKHACIDLTGVSPLVGLGNRPFVVGQAACRAASAKVHITQGDHEGKAVIVSWVTMKEPGSKTMSYWKDGESKNKKVEKGKITTYKYYTYKSGYIHHCTIRHLEFDTKYHYEVGSGDSSRTFWFKTPPQAGPDVPYTFGLIGDLGQSFDSNRTLTHYQKNPSKGQTVLYVGDLSYADNFTHHDNTKWDTWGRFVERSTAYQPWIWTAGNHEIDFAPEIGETKPFKPFTHRYPTPYRASNSTAPFWYSIKRGPAYIIVLSSYSAYGKYTPQYTWLKEELPKVNRSETPWLIVLMHSPWYNSNNYHYMEGESMRVVYEPWFIDYKKRISNIAYNIVNGECKPTIDESAPVYITIGDGGNLEGLALNMTYPQPEYSAFREASFGHAILEIKNRTHAYYAWHRNQDGFAVEADKMWFFNRVWHPVNDLEIA